MDACFLLNHHRSSMTDTFFRLIFQADLNGTKRTQGKLLAISRKARPCVFFNNFSTNCINLIFPKHQNFDIRGTKCGNPITCFPWAVPEYYSSESSQHTGLYNSISGKITSNCVSITCGFSMEQFGPADICCSLQRK